MATQLGQDICRTAIWEQISGWQVVAAVVVIVGAWSFVQVARMHYMAVVARTNGRPNQET